MCVVIWRFESVISFGSVLRGLILHILVLDFFILHRCQIQSFYMFSECMIFHTCSKTVRQRDRHLSLGIFAKLQIATVSFILSVCLSVSQYGTNRLPLDIFSWNIIFEDFSKICFENSSLIKNLTRMTGTLHEDVHTFIISQWILHRMINVQAEVVKKITTYILCSVIPPPLKIVPFMR